MYVQTVTKLFLPMMRRTLRHIPRSDERKLNMKLLAAVYIFTIISMSVEMGWILTKGSRTRQTFSFIVCQLLLNIWSASQLILLEAVNDRQLFLAYCVGNTGICFIGTAWLCFAYITVRRKMPMGLIIFTAGFSAVMWLLALTNGLHKLFYSSFSMNSVEHGILFYINIAYTYFCMIYGTLLLCLSLGSEKRRRRQVLLLILAAVIPLGSNMLYLFGAIDTIYDITPLAFSVSSVLALLATDRYGFLNVNDIAFDRALESISEGVAVFGRGGVMTYSNRRMRELFDLGEDAEKADFDSRLGSRRLAELENTGETEISLSGKIINLRRYVCSEKSGRSIAVTFIASDITRYYDMAKQEQALSEAKARLAAERERNRITQEVHDTAGHTLTMINSLAKLTGIAIDSGDYETAGKYAAEAQQLSSSGIAQLRVSINNLRSREDNSLITEGLRQLVSSVRGLDADLCIQGEDSLKYSFCSNVIYENTREAITNCIKYSGADRIDIIVKLLEKSAEVYIIDNGKGCSEIVCGNGLRGMRERTEKIGGSIKFSSGESCGFSITMKFPIIKED